MCDIWKAPRRNMALDLIEQLAHDAHQLGTQMVLFSGGEAMQHPEWPMAAQYFRQVGIKVWLLTNGLSLKKQSQSVIGYIDQVTVSLDAATPDLYQQIRGVDALEVILQGMQVVSDSGVSVSTRTTVMRANYHQLPLIIDTALGAGASSVSFLAVDTVNPYAFGPRFEETMPLTNTNPYGALLEEDLPHFASVLDSLEQTHAAHFHDGRIAESPAKLRRLYHYFAAPYNQATFEPPRCNAPHLSVVINVDGSLQPCYFLPSWGKLDGQHLQQVLNQPSALGLRRAYRQGERPECARCVCPLYRGPRALLQGF